MSATVTEQIDDIKQRFGGLNKRMQRLVISGILALTYAVVDLLVVQPLMEEYSEVTKAIEKTKSESKAYAVQLLNMQNELGIDPSMTEEEQMARLRTRLTELEDDIARTTSRFVSSENMTDFIYQTIDRSKGLNLVSLNKYPLETLVIKTAKEQTKDESKAKNKNAKGKVDPAPMVEYSEDKFYKHSIEVVLQGKYSDIVTYMKRLEKMPWRVFWQAAELRSNYPITQVHLTLYTLSLDQRWMTL